MTNCKHNVKTIHDVMDYCITCTVKKVETMNTCQIGKDIMEAAIEAGKNFKQKEIATRTQDSIIAELKTGTFVTCPGDVYTIQHSTGVISSSITILLTNEKRGEKVWFSVNNKMAAWAWLKRLNEVAARKVMYQIDDQTAIDYKDSIPYQHRFGGLCS